MVKVGVNRGNEKNNWKFYLSVKYKKKYLNFLWSLNFKNFTFLFMVEKKN